MAYGAHDMGLIALMVNGIAHGFSIDCQALVPLAVGFVPLLKSSVQMLRVDTDEDIADDVLAWNDKTALFIAASEAFTCFLAKALCPVRDGFVAAHSAKDCTSCEGQHGGDSMTTSLLSARIGDLDKEVR